MNSENFQEALLTMDSRNKFYLPQLDGLRFFAFFLVFIHHFMPLTPFLKENHTAYNIMRSLHNFGWIGVDLFLTLSAFLLTTLLAIEHQSFGQFSIKKFFIRRALRIWPLYYLIIILSFFIFPIFHFLSPEFHSPIYTNFIHQHLIPFSLFLGNFSYAFFTSSLTIPIMPLWTISLEEQFYFIWPILLFILFPLRKKWFYIILSLMIILSVIIRIYIISNQISYPAIWVLTFARLDPFALGAMISYFYLNNDHRSWPLMALCAAIFLLKAVISSTLIGLPNTIWQFFAVDLASALLIYTAIYSQFIKKILSIQLLRWLGKISFGLYVYHFMLINLLYPYYVRLIEGLEDVHRTKLVIWGLFFCIALGLTIACAALSYYLYEKPFLKFKDKFTVINSRPA